MSLDSELLLALVDQALVALQGDDPDTATLTLEQIKFHLLEESPEESA